MKKMRSALVYYDKELAGFLREIPDGTYEFSYAKNYINQPEPMPISLTFPVREEPFKEAALFPFFEGLLPEGWLLELICSTLKIDKKDSFGLLMKTGGDTAGMVTIKPEFPNNELSEK